MKKTHGSHLWAWLLFPVWFSDLRCTDSRRSEQVCHMQACTPETGYQKSPSAVGQLECSICYSGYENVFKTPDVLNCAHTFCLECLTNLMVVPPTDGRHVPNHISWPFCRQTAMLPPGSEHQPRSPLHAPSPSAAREARAAEGNQRYKSSGCGEGSDGLTGQCICSNIRTSKREPQASRCRCSLCVCSINVW